MDLYVESLIAPLRTAAGLDFFLFFTEIARAMPLTILLATTALFFWVHGLRSYAYALLLSVAGSELVSYLLKLLVARARPGYALLDESTFSFPSGHAVVGFSFFALFFFLVARKAESEMAANALRLAGIVFASLVALSRLYLGVHYATDVIAGSAIGIVACVLALRYVAG
ncbi:MAG: phosphatase PAP2 family protein [Patescibacteria group bacterium]